MVGFSWNFAFCGLALWTAWVYLKARNYWAGFATLTFAVILAICGIMAIRPV